MRTIDLNPMFFLFTVIIYVGDKCFYVRVFNPFFRGFPKGFWCGFHVIQVSSEEIE